MHAQLETLSASVAAQMQTVSDLFSSRPAEVWVRRPMPKKWSAVEHLEHINLANAAYLASLEECVERARERGWLKDGPYGGRWLAERLVTSQEPPPKQNLPTFKKIKPAPALDLKEVYDRFQALGQEYERILRSSEGLDLGRAAFRSPLLSLMKLSAMQGFRLIDSHNRRHLWHIEKALAT